MRLGKYEFGLIKPLQLLKFERSVESCGCILYTLACFYFTILKKYCSEAYPVHQDSTPPLSKDQKSILTQLGISTSSKSEQRRVSLPKQQPKKRRPRRRRRKNGNAKKT